jgi:hypothetical protein
MIEIHSKVHCRCGARYHHMFVQDIPPSPQETVISRCPICSTDNKISYEFKATCKHCGGFFNFDHFSKNDGFTDTEYYPRQCQCGQETILEQRRTR